MAIDTTALGTETLAERGWDGGSVCRTGDLLSHTGVIHSARQGQSTRLRR